MTESFRDGLVTGLLTGVLIELIRFLFTHRKALATLAKGPKRRKYSHLSGEWFQYHLTLDKASQNAPIWVLHKDLIRVSPLLRVNGESSNEYKTKLQYRITGQISKARLILHYENVLTDEEEVTVTIDNVLSNDLLSGVWIGYNFDQTLTTGPIVLARSQMSDVDLDNLLTNRGDIIIQNRQHYG